MDSGCIHVGMVGCVLLTRACEADGAGSKRVSQVSDPHLDDLSRLSICCGKDVCVRGPIVLVVKR